MRENKFTESQTTTRGAQLGRRASGEAGDGPKPNKDRRKV